MTIKQKLLGSFLCIAAFVAVVGIFGSWGLLTMSHGIHSLDEISLSEIDHTNRAARRLAKIHVQRNRLIYAGYATAEAADTISKIRKCFEEIGSDIDWLINESTQHLATSLSFEDRAQEIEHLRAVQQAHDLLTRWHDDWEVRIKNTHGQLISDADSDEKAEHLMLQTLLDLENASRNDASGEVQEMLHNTNWIPRGFIIVSAAAFLAALGIGLALSNSLSRRLRQATLKTAELGQGNLSVRINDAQSDELGQLAAEFNAMAARLFETQQRLARATATAEASNRAKSEFLANMSHEIRTPMTAILGFTDLILDPILTAEQRSEHVNTVRRNGEHLLTVINDILDISKIEAGRMEVESIECSPCQTIAEIAAIMRVRAASKNLTLDVDYVFPVPEIIHTDPLRLRQILLNLVGNAIKFTEIGGVKIAVRSDGASHANPVMHFDVIDSGIGIEPSSVKRLFEPFMQADNSLVRRFGGTGLGLAISRRFAQMMGGDITLDSSPGAGSRFTLTLPVGSLAGVKMIQNAHEAIISAEPDPKASQTPDDCCDGRILLVEDGLDNQRLIKFYLTRAGAEITLAENGQLALDAVIKAALEKQPFDLILMDMQMPVMDGYAATAELRKRGYAKPIIALTAHAMSEDRARCISVGCSDYLSKPIAAHLLTEAVAKHLKASRSPAQTRVA